MQDAEQSVTGWLHALREGDDDAAKELWNRYFRRIVRLAKHQLPPDAVDDEEDLAVICRKSTASSEIASVGSLCRK